MQTEAAQAQVFARLEWAASSSFVGAEWARTVGSYTYLPAFTGLLYEEQE